MQIPPVPPSPPPHDPNQNDPTYKAREAYFALYSQFLFDTKNKDPSKWDTLKVEQDVQYLLKFLKNPNNEKLLAQFAKEHGTPPGPFGSFSNEYNAAITSLEHFNPQTPDAAFEFTRDLFHWISYHS